jgi:hypothetical protein
LAEQFVDPIFCCSHVIALSGGRHEKGLFAFDLNTYTAARGGEVIE